MPAAVVVAITAIAPLFAAPGFRNETVAPAGSPVKLKVTVPVVPVRTRATVLLALEPSGTVSVAVESWRVMPLGVTGVMGATDVALFPPPHPFDRETMQINPIEKRK